MSLLDAREHGKKMLERWFYLQGRPNLVAVMTSLQIRNTHALAQEIRTEAMKFSDEEKARQWKEVAHWVDLRAEKLPAVETKFREQKGA